MSIKLHFLQSHLNYFPKNCGDLSKKQGERFHQDICIMEERYQSRWDGNFLSGYCCWCLKQDAMATEHGFFFPEMTFHPCIASFVYFSVYSGTVSAFCEYINPKFSIICLIQQENKKL